MKQTKTGQFEVGDHAAWNSEAGHVAGTIVKAHRKKVEFKGYMHDASAEYPQYEIKSDATNRNILLCIKVQRSRVRGRTEMDNK